MNQRFVNTVLWSVLISVGLHVGGVRAGEVSEGNSENRTNMRVKVRAYADMIRSAFEATQQSQWEKASDLLSATDPDLRSWEYVMLRKLIAEKEAQKGPYYLPVRRAPHPGMMFHCAAFDPENKQLAFGYGDGKIQIFSLDRAEENGTMPHIIPLPDGKQVWMIAFSRDGNYMVCGNEKGQTFVWQTSSWSHIATFAEGDLPVRDVAISPDGSKIVSEHRSGMLLWDRTTERKIARLAQRYMFMYGGSVAFGTKGDVISVGGMSDVRIFDATTGAPVRQMEHAHYTMHVAMSAEGRYVASGTRGSFPKSVAMFDVSTGKQLFEVSKHEHGISDVVFSHDGKRVVSASADRTMRFWHIPTGEEVFRIQMGSTFGDLNVSNDGTILTWSTNRGVQYFTVD